MALELEFDEAIGALVFAGAATGDVKTLLQKGDLTAATRAYEAGRGRDREALVQHAQQLPQAAPLVLGVFQAAHDHAGAARLQELTGNHAAAAALYETARQPAQAAQAWKAAGNLAKAASATERSGELDLAVEMYASAGSREDEAALLARQGQHFRAAVLYGQLGNLHAEVDMLRQVAMHDPQRVNATRRLAFLMESHGRFEQALALVGETARALPAARADRDLQLQFVRLLERLGRADEAARIRAALGPGVPAPVAMAPAPAPPTLPSAADAFERAYEYLKAMPIFAELSLTDLQDLYRVALEVSFPAGVSLIEQGLKGMGLYVLVQGSVEVTAVTPGQPPRALNVLSAGEHVGEISLVQDAPTSARVVATTDVEALFISRDAFHRYLEKHDAAAMAIWRHFAVTLAERVRVLSAR